MCCYGLLAVTLGTVLVATYGDPNASNTRLKNLDTCETIYSETGSGNNDRCSCVITVSEADPKLKSLIHLVDHVTEANSPLCYLAFKSRDEQRSFHTAAAAPSYCVRDLAELQVGLSGILLKIQQLPSFPEGDDLEKYLMELKRLCNNVVDTVINIDVIITDIEIVENFYLEKAKKLDATLRALQETAIKGIRRAREMKSSSLTTAGTTIATTASTSSTTPPTTTASTTSTTPPTTTASTSSTTPPTTKTSAAATTLPTTTSTSTPSTLTPKIYPKSFTEIKTLSSSVEQLEAYKQWLVGLRSRDYCLECAQIAYHIHRLCSSSTSVQVREQARSFLSENVHGDFLRILEVKGFFNLENHHYRGSYVYLGRTTSKQKESYLRDPDFFWDSAMQSATVTEVKGEDKWKYQLLPVTEEDGQRFYLRNKLMSSKTVPPSKFWNDNFVNLIITSTFFISNSKTQELQLIFCRNKCETDAYGIRLDRTQDGRGMDSLLPGMQIAPWQKYHHDGDTKWIPRFVD